MIDRKLKFPNLKKGEVGIQVGFDMSSSNLTTDLIRMYQCVGNNGLVIGIDPDPFNVEKAKKIINQYNYNIKIIEKATYSRKGITKLMIAKRSSWNRIDLIEADDHPVHSNHKIVVDMDTLDNIINNLV